MTGKELLKKLQQERFDVKGYPVVLKNTEGDDGEPVNIVDIELDAENKRIVLVLAGDEAAK